LSGWRFDRGNHKGGVSREKKEDFGKRGFYVRGKITREHEKREEGEGGRKSPRIVGH